MEIQDAIDRIERALAEFDALRAKSQYDDCSDQPDRMVAMTISMLANTIQETAPEGSRYREDSGREIAKHSISNPYLLTVLPGLAGSIKRDYTLGHATPPSSKRVASVPPLEAKVMQLPEKITARWLFDHVPYKF